MPCPLLFHISFPTEGQLLPQAGRAVIQLPAQQGLAVAAAAVDCTGARVLQLYTADAPARAAIHLRVRACTASEWTEVGRLLYGMTPTQTNGEWWYSQFSAFDCTLSRTHARTCRRSPQISASGARTLSVWV